jgi:cytochrome c oxidase assembly protein subunit 15
MGAGFGKPAPRSMHPTNVVPLRSRRYPVLVASCTFALVVAGALVTSNDAAGSIPDWPLNWGRIIPPLEANIRYEFAHRALAALTLLLVAGLAWRERTKLAWAALGTVIAQAAVGALLVKWIDPASLAVVHASLAMLCFGLVCGAGLQACAEKRDAQVWRPAPLGAATALFAQTILGAMVRHNLVGPIPHIIGAVIATALVMWAGLGTLMSHMDEPALRRPAMALLSLTFSQVFLGIAAFAVRAAAVGDPQPMPATIWITVAHVAMGSLAFGSAIMLAMASEVRRTALECALT